MARGLHRGGGCDHNVEKAMKCGSLAKSLYGTQECETVTIVTL